MKNQQTLRVVAVAVTQNRTRQEHDHECAIQMPSRRPFLDYDGVIVEINLSRMQISNLEANFVLCEETGSWGHCDGRIRKGREA